MHENAHKFITRIDADHAKSRARVMRSLSGEANAPQDVLLRWIVENDINPYGVFTTRWAADAFSSYEGMDGLLHMINHALEDDGDISFIECEGTEPKIVFMDHREPYFREAFLKDIKTFGHGDRTLSIFEPIGTYPDVNAYIVAYEEHAARMREQYERFMGGCDENHP